MTPRSAVLSVLLAALLFSTSGTAQAIADAGSTPLSVGATRLFVGGALLVLLLPRLGSPRREVVTLWRWPSVLIAGAAAGLYQVTFFAGVRGAGVALGTLLVVGSAPLFAGILGLVFLRHRPSLTWAVATLVCVTGLVLLSAQGITAGTPRGVLLSLVAGFSVASYTVAAKQVLDRGTPPTLLMASTFTFGGLFLVPLYVREPLAWLTEPRGIALALYLGVFTMVAANWLHVRGLSVLGPAPVTTLMLAEPLLATLLGVTLLREPLGTLAIVGLVLVLIGLLFQGGVLARRRPVAEEIVSPL